MLVFTQVIAFKQQVLMYSQLATEGDEVLRVVPGEEAATRRALPAPPADLRDRL